MIEQAQAASVDLSQEFGFGYIGSVATTLEHLLPLAFTVAGLAIIFYFLYGAFKIITAGADKEALASARAMITHSIVGFILLMLMFLILKYITAFFGIEYNLLPGWK